MEQLRLCLAFLFKSLVDLGRYEKHRDVAICLPQIDFSPTHHRRPQT